MQKNFLYSEFVAQRGVGAKLSHVDRAVADVGGEAAGAFADGALDVALAHIATDGHGPINMNGAAVDRQVHPAGKAGRQNDMHVAGATAKIRDNIVRCRRCEDRRDVPTAGASVQTGAVDVLARHAATAGIHMDPMGLDMLDPHRAGAGTGPAGPYLRGIREPDAAAAGVKLNVAAAEVVAMDRTAGGMQVHGPLDPGSLDGPTGRTGPHVAGQVLHLERPRGAFALDPSLPRHEDIVTDADGPAREKARLVRPDLKPLAGLQEANLDLFGQFLGLLLCGGPHADFCGYGGLVSLLADGLDRSAGRRDDQSGPRPHWVLKLDRPLKSGPVVPVAVAVDDNAPPDEQ